MAARGAIDDVTSGADELRSLTYVSSATRLLSGDELVAMLEAIRPRNAERELSGMLLYSGGNIIQVLEGPGPAVERTFAQIRRDERHHDVTVLNDEPVVERSFGDWSMGFRDVGPRSDEDRARHHATDGVNDVMTGGEVGTRRAARADDGPTNVERLLELFRRSMR